VNNDFHGSGCTVHLHPELTIDCFPTDIDCLAAIETHLLAA